MKKTIFLFLGLVVALVLVIVPLSGALAQDKMPPPLDPQSWKLQRDMSWRDLKPNPVIDWMKELNAASLDNKFAWGGNDPNTEIIGGFLMFEYLERKFITRGEAGSDPLGYYLFKDDGTGMQSEKTRNPVVDVYQLVADEKYSGDKTKVTDADFGQWWVDYLNKPQAINKGVTISEFWRENSYGKWSVDLRPYGPFTIPYFEFETMGYCLGSRFQTYNDVPPSFRRGTTTSNYFGFDSIAQAMAVEEGVPFKDFDFFFLVHAGNAESGVWQEFGQLQFASRKDIPYELGPGPRMATVEKFFTDNPDYLPLYVSRYAAYPGGATFRTNLDAYNALKETGDEAAFVFHLAADDWAWVDGYNDMTTKNTRYVDFTSWEAAVSEWSHAGSYSYRDPETGQTRSIRRSTQGENSGMSVFAHEFGHISGIADNYGDPWGDVASPATEPWEQMSRGSFAGPFGDHARWTVPGIEASSVPVHFMQRNKEYSMYYNAGDVLTLSVQELAAATPLVTEVVSRNIPLANEYYPWLADYGLISPNYYKAIKLNFGSGAWADQAALRTSGYTWTRKAAALMTVEVVDQSGYDSFNHDHGVLISRTHTNTGNPSHAIIDAHLYDIDMVDFYLSGEPNYYPVAHATQLADAAFHAGLSFTDTGYYRGGEFKGDKRASSEVISGNTVNEFYDPYNKLHFYILDKHLTPAKYGEFLSYQIGLRHDNGPAVGGNLEVKVADVEAEKPGRVAVATFDITNTGDATDIIRVGAAGLNAVLLNNLYAIEAGQTISVPVYVELAANITAKDVAGQDIVFTATSETNGEKVGVATVAAQDLVIFNFYVYFAAAKADVNIGQTLFVDVMLQGDKNYTQFNASIAYDAARLEFAGFTNLSGLAAEVKKDGADKISLRSVPSLNMILGVPCVVPVRIVTLKFTVKDSFAAESIDTKLIFAATAVNPTAGAAVIVAPGKPLPVTLHQKWVIDTPEQSIEKITALYPDFIKDEQTQPVFTYSGTNNQNTNTSTIFEEVWIEVPCDTDEDGRRDMIRIEVCRPAVTGEIIDADTGETKVSVPVLINHSPYNNSSSGISGYSPAPAFTVTRRPMWRVVLDLAANPSTADHDYFTDVRTNKPRSHEWYWGLEAMYWDYTAKAWVTDDLGGNGSWYVNPRAGISDGAWFIPASRGARPQVFRGNWPASPSTMSGNNLYFYQRGYAIVTSSSLGNAFKELVAEGFNNTSNVEETLAPMSVIKWLNGECKGYTSRAATTEVAATWCNGYVAMTGTSYDGTLSFATASSGVTAATGGGIKAILPVAGESNKYDYYRGGGTVTAPDGGWQGEDTDYLAYRCFAWYLDTYFYNPTYETAGMQYYKATPAVAALFKGMMDVMAAGQNRGSGDYSSYWDDRNYLTTIDHVPDDCGVMIMHGLNDWNVKTKHADQYYRAAKAANKQVKGLWHLGGHATVWGMTDSHYMEYFHLWMDRFLYKLDNDAEHIIPETNIPSNNNVNWEFYDQWPIPGTADQRFYFGAASVEKAGSLLAAAPAAANLGTIKDDIVANAALINPDDFAQNFNRPYPGSTGIVNGQIGNWENRLFAPAVMDSPSAERLAFATDVLAEPLRINGTVRIGLELSSDTPWGVISAALVEVGPNYRAFSTVSSNYAISNALSQYKIVTRGHADVQNPNPAKESYLTAPKAHGYVPAYLYRTQTIIPGVSNQYYFEFQPMDYTFKAGTRLAIYVYTSDYRHTIVPENSPTLTLYAGANTFVDLPIVPTYSIFYDANGGTSLYDALGGYSDAYPIAGQSVAAWEGGYRVIGGVGNTTVAKLVAPAGGTFTGWNTKVDGSGIAYQPGDRIPDAQMGSLTLYAQWSGIAAPAVEEIEAAAVVLLEDDEEIVVVE